VDKFACHAVLAEHEGRSMQASRTSDCAVGLHKPRLRRSDVPGQAIQRSECRCCGATLMKSAVSRRWILSGMLG
jgi:hypothetical protein